MEIVAFVGLDNDQSRFKIDLIVWKYELQSRSPVDHGGLK